MNPIKELTILYTNDYHSQERPVKATWVKDSPMMGGIAYLASYIKKFRDQDPEALLLDAGDIITGSPMSMLTEGTAPIDLFNMLGYDAAALGNHEFDHGWRNAKRLIHCANFPILSANIYYENTNVQFAKPYEIIEKNGLRIGVVAIHGKKAGYETISRQCTEGIEFRSQEAILQENVNLLRPHVDVIVALTHEGVPAEQASEDREVVVERDFEEDVYIASHVRGIDVLIAGHNHKNIDPPYVAATTGTIIVSTRALGTVLGVLKLHVDSERHKVVGHHGYLQPVLTAGIHPDPQVAARVDYWEEQSKTLINQVIGFAEGKFTRNYFGECSLGNLLTDAVRSQLDVDVSFYQGGGMRADLAMGDTTIGRCIDVNPFPSLAYIMEFSGENLMRILEESASLKAGVLQQSGLKMVVDVDREVGNRVVEATIRGKPIDYGTTYRVAASGFLMKGGDGFVEFLRADKIWSTGVVERDYVVEYIRKTGTIRPKTDGRTVVIGNMEAYTAVLQS
ncbi:bifunctional metallophosphatase/5'-nucleotidase [Paenibacillus cymbidii]|uniref:bifunctional metallophosphatase/5'-nucleotidase n=1 Tax=Paenibacillus cymbidii TaxID=1639034 RepID=UPI00107FFAC3|nr:bifunctional UDP-sugar hydrolase/5'-nucleotidase [Paenibacillus cymbidii]